MKKLLAFVLAAIMTFSLVACGGNSAANADTPGSNVTAGQTGDSDSTGKTEDGNSNVADAVSYKTDVVIGVSANITEFDPQLQNNFHHTRMQQLVYDRLVYYDATAQQLSPMLAESWEISPDASEYTFKLRQDVTFHNGEKFTADDVIFTVERGKGSSVSTIATYFQYVDKCEALDEHTVKMTLTTSNSDLLYGFAQPYMGMLNREACEADPEKGYEIGTGLWVWEEKVDNDHFSFTRNDNYWGGETPTEHLELRIIPEDSARLIALENGEVDLCEPLAVSDLEFAKANDELDVIGVDTVTLSYIAFAMEKDGVWHDKNFRMAVAHAVDWDAFILGYKDGYAVRATSVWSHAQFGYAPQEGYDYDVEKAKEYLAKTDYSGETLTLSVVPTYKAAAMIMIDMLAKVGINAELNEIQSAQFSASIKEGQYDMTIYQITLGVAGSEASRMFITGTVGSRAVKSTEIWDDLNSLLEEALAASDNNKRMELYAEVQRLVAEEATIIPLIYPQSFIGIRKGLEGVVYAANTDYDYRFIQLAE